MFDPLLKSHALLHSHLFLPLLIFMILLFIIYWISMCVNMHVWTHAHKTVLEEVRGQLVGVSFLLLYVGLKN